MSRTLAPLLALSFVASVGCGTSRHTGGGMDLGIVVDAGPGTDSGPPHDAGPGHDSGPITFDAGGPGGDAGCGLPVMAVTMAVCPASVTSCLTTNMCMDATCDQMCIDMDTTGNCNACITINELACGNMNGCMSQYVAWDCCLSAHCPMGSPMTCGMTNCATQISGLQSCLMTALGGASPPACAMDVNNCLMM